MWVAYLTCLSTQATIALFKTCCILLTRHFGEMAERFKALVSKTSMGVLSHRGFESHSLRVYDMDSEIGGYMIGERC